MKKYKIRIDIEALQDIQEATDWYNLQSSGLGTRFQKQTKQQINTLKTKATAFSTHYSNVKCMLIKKISFLVHFTIDSTNCIVEIFAVFHTSRNPTIWIKRKPLQ